jgi:hypothetical protein
LVGAGVGLGGAARALEQHSGGRHIQGSHLSSFDLAHDDAG